MKTTLLSFSFMVCVSITGFSQTLFGSQQIIDSFTGNDPKVLESGFIDGDEYIDIIVCNSDSTIVWYKNNGNGTFTKQSNIINTANTINGIYLVDLNADSFLDIVASSFSGKTTSWYANDGKGNFGPEQSIAKITSISMAFGTIDSGATVDVAASVFEQNVVWFANDGSGTFGSAQTMEKISFPPPGPIALKDMDNDGDLDLIRASSYGMADGDKIGIFRNNLIPGGTVTFIEDPNPVISKTSGFNSMLVEDTDGDGDYDILAVELGAGTISGQLYLFENNGSGFSQNIIPTTINYPYFVRFEDMDNDNLKDIILQGYIQDLTTKIVWFKNNGAGSFAPESALEGGFENISTMYVIADFDNDKDMDVASIFSKEKTLFWVENISVPTGIPEIDYHNIEIYPNPTDGKFSIEFDNTKQSVTVRILSLTGQVVVNKQFQNKKMIQLELNQPDGIYIVETIDEQGNKAALKLIKQ